MKNTSEVLRISTLIVEVYSSNSKQRNCSGSGKNQEGSVGYQHFVSPSKSATVLHGMCLEDYLEQRKQKSWRLPNNKDYLGSVCGPGHFSPIAFHRILYCVVEDSCVKKCQLHVLSFWSIQEYPSLPKQSPLPIAGKIESCQSLRKLRRAEFYTTY